MVSKGSFSNGVRHVAERKTERQRGAGAGEQRQGGQAGRVRF